MDGIEDFDPACFGLAEIRSAVFGGLAAGRSQRRGGPAEDHVGELLAQLEHYSVDLAAPRRRAHDYEVAANWKGIAENYNECLHCPGVHPELNALSDYMSGEGLYGAGAWCGGSMTLTEGAETMGTRGRPRPATARRSPASTRATCATSSTSHSSPTR